MGLKIMIEIYFEKNYNKNILIYKKKNSPYFSHEIVTEF